MRRIVSAALTVTLMVASAPVAFAADDASALFPGTAHPWHVGFDGHEPASISPVGPAAPAFVLAASDAPLLIAVPFEATPAVQGSAPQKAVVYSDGYNLRLKIHKYASWATIPLFVSQAIVGQKLYDGDASSTLKSTHSALAATTGVLFGLNTVTGAWNLWEGRKDPNGRTRRIIHSVLMLAADAAFLATAGNAPESEHGEFEDSKSSHRNAAVIGFSSASVAYAMMLIGR